MDKKIKRYNDLMNRLCLEHLTIGTSLTEDPKEKEKWNLRDLVSEVQYHLDVYNDPNCVYYEEAHNTYDRDHKNIYNQWRNDIGRMKRFVERYEKEAMAMECYQGHCSRYD